MQKLEGHTPLFVRIPCSLFDAAHAEAKRRQVVLRVVITEALQARFEAAERAPVPSVIGPGAAPSGAPVRSVLVREREPSDAKIQTKAEQRQALWKGGGR